jgi:hypothetical protein
MHDTVATSGQYHPVNIYSPAAALAQCIHQLQSSHDMFTSCNQYTRIHQLQHDRNIFTSCCTGTIYASCNPSTIHSPASALLTTFTSCRICMTHSPAAVHTRHTPQVLWHLHNMFTGRNPCTPFLPVALAQYIHQLRPSHIASPRAALTQFVQQP